MPKTILVLDFDGPINSFNDWYSNPKSSSLKQEDREKSLGASGTYVNNPLLENRSVYISVEDAALLKTILKSLADNEIQVVCGSQRITYRDETQIKLEQTAQEQTPIKEESALKSNMYQLFDQVFGTPRNFLQQDQSLEQLTQAFADSSGTNKNPLLAATRKLYGDETTQVILADDNEGYKDQAISQGFGFVHIPSAYTRESSSYSDAEQEKRNAAYVKMWLVALSNAVDAEKLAREVAAHQAQFSKEFDYLMEHDSEAQEILIVSFALKLCNDYLKEHPLTDQDKKPQLRLEKDPYDDAQDSPQYVVNDIKSSLMNTCVSFKERIDKMKAVTANEKVAKIMEKCSWSDRFLHVLKNFFTGHWKTMTMSPAQVAAHDMKKLMRPTQEARTPSPTPLRVG